MFRRAVCTGGFVIMAASGGWSQSVTGDTCRPVSERTRDIGCWILAHESIGAPKGSQVYWYLDRHLTLAAAQTAKGTHGTVVEALGATWLLTIEPAGWKSTSGERVATIGPITISAGSQYSAQYMEAIFAPGMTSSVHRHSGAEAWYTQTGETCLETPGGKVIGRAGGPPVIVPDGPMHLTATGTELRRSLVLILHDASKPATTVISDWTPKGLCKS